MANRRNELRHLLIVGLQNKLPRRGASQRLPRGFWSSAAEIVALFEGVKAPGPEELQVWWMKHCQRCHETPEVIVPSMRSRAF